MSVSIDESPIDLLADLYAFSSDLSRARVMRFVERYPDLPAILLDARDALRGIFPDGAYMLDVKRDPDIGDEQLVLAIAIKRDPASPRGGLKKLLALQDAWGIDADQRAKGHITIVLTSA
jgi:hypothetical protein